MKRRKTIALLTALPEGVHVRRTITGILHQCEKYGYNLCVFSPMGPLDFSIESYKTGEANIYELPNTDLLDGIILDSAQLVTDPSGKTAERLCERFGSLTDIPVVALEIPLGCFPVINNRDEVVLREMCRHAIEVHGKKKLCIITGHKGNEAAEYRLEIFLDEIAKHGLSVLPEHIVYGDFWYGSGDRLAGEILDGSVAMPDAILCASDFMALGLIARLSNNGIKIPEDMIIIGFDATEEGACNRLTLTSFESNDTNSAADAVDYIRSIIEPNAEILPYEIDRSKIFHPAMSCGCEPDYLRSARSLRNALYLTSRNYSDPYTTAHADIGLLMESYAFESFTGSQTPEECLEKIYENTYILYPFENYSLCLTEDWLDIDEDRVHGYPDKMRISVATSSVGDHSFHEHEESVLFDTALMLPKLSEDSEKPSVFYFSPVHFSDKLLGYSVIQRDINDTYMINLVHRNWLRFVNNALEMIRNKKRLQMLSVRDEMTGVYNRRGMNVALEKMLSQADSDSSLFVLVIDMDGLKSINDTYGHSEGDLCIKLLSSAVTAIMLDDEICVRAGGDEFYLIGVGSYTSDDLQKRMERFTQTLERKSLCIGKPYTIAASIGGALRSADSSLTVQDAIGEADKKMYQSKVSRKMQRQ